MRKQEICRVEKRDTKTVVDKEGNEKTEDRSTYNQRVKIRESKKVARDWEAFFSRCYYFELTNQVNSAFAKRGYEIARKEGFADIPEEEAIKKLEKFLYAHHGNFRTMLNAIESGLLEEATITS